MEINRLLLGGQLLVWLLGILFLMHLVWNKKLISVGLVATYMMDFFLNHWLGAWIFIFPWYERQSAYLLSQGAPEHTLEGFAISTWGFVFFLLGVLFKRKSMIRKWNYANKESNVTRPSSNMPIVYFWTAILMRFFLVPLLQRIPSIFAVFTTTWPLVVASICLLIYQADLKYKPMQSLFWLGLACLGLPIVTTVGQGFLGFGVRAAMGVILFFICFHKPNWKTVLMYLAVVYIGLSVYVTYMSDRNALRETVWAQSASLERKILKTWGTFKNFQLFDVYSQVHLEVIDERLNQNSLVGRVSEYMRGGYKEFAHGSTVVDAFIALVPRVIWPNKPYKAGSGNMVSDYSGMQFAEGTSVGVGQVIEFYLNFGIPGVIVGFFILGCLITVFDGYTFINLKIGNWQKFIFWMLPGICFINSGGALAEVVVSIASAMIFAILINKFILPRFGSRMKKLKISRGNLLK